MARGIKRILAHPLFMPGVVLLSVVLLVGSIDNGLLMDDHIHRVMMQGEHNLPWPETAPWNLYAMIPGDGEFMARSVEKGFSPWWGSRSFQASFFRPLSSLSLYLDYLLWPDNFRLMHIHSLLWLALMLAAAGLVYKRFCGSVWLAGLTLLLYGLDDNRIHPATWIANRNSLIAVTFVFFSLAAHDKWRKNGWSAGAIWGPLCFAVALLAGEFALGGFGYIISYCIFIEDHSWMRRIKGILPYVAVVIVWRVVYRWMGYGAWGSDLYIDPLADPVSFLFQGVVRFPVLFNSLLGIPGSELMVIVPSTFRPIVVGGAVLGTLVFGGVIWVLMKKQRMARFWIVGSCLSLIPVCATFPHDRLLILAGLGGSACVGMFLGFWLQQPFVLSDSGLKRFFLRSVALFWLAIHLVMSPLSTPPRATLVNLMGKITDRAASSIQAGPKFSEETLVILTAPDLFLSGFFSLWRHSLELPQPNRVHVISNGVEPVVITRESEKSLLVRIDTGHFGVWTHALVRRGDDRWVDGRQIQHQDALVTILEATPDGEPTVIRVAFEKSLTDPSYRFVYWKEHGYEDLNMLSIGESIVLDIDEQHIFDL